jgi:hypothetical protein
MVLLLPVSILALHDDIPRAVRENRSKLHEKLAPTNVTGPGLNRAAVAWVFPPRGIRNPVAVHPARNREHLACTQEVGPEVLICAGQFPIRIDRLDDKPGMVVDPRRLWRKRLGTRSDRQCKQPNPQSNTIMCTHHETSVLAGSCAPTICNQSDIHLDDLRLPCERAFFRQPRCRFTACEIFERPAVSARQPSCLQSDA